MALMNARDLIASTIKGQIAPVLKSKGFLKKGTLWTRAAADTVQLVGLQSSQWSVEDEGAFTFNLGVHWPTPYDDLIREPWPRSPNEGFCVFSRRIGRLLRPAADTWWNVSRSSKLEEVGQSAVQALIDFAVPELDRFDSLSAIHEYLQRPMPEDRTVHNVMRLMVLQAQLGLAEEVKRTWLDTQTGTWAPERRERANRLAHQLVDACKLPIDLLH